MVLSKGQVMVVFVLLLCSPILFWLLLWASVMLSPDLYTHELSKTGLWPVICSTRGCVTTSGWHKHYQARVLFAEAAKQEVPSPEEALTTLARQHLVDRAMTNWSVTKGDARRYREEVLQTKDEVKILESTGLAVADYDKFVILPLLKQEVLREQMKVDDFDEMFKRLAQERRVWALPRGLIWDKESATVVRR